VQSVCPNGKADYISDFISEKNIYLTFLTETWLKPHGHEPKIKQLTPPGYKTISFPRLSQGGGIAIILKEILEPSLSFSHNLQFSHESFEVCEINLNLPGHSITICCLYRPPPSRKNNLTSSLFHQEFQSLLDHYSLSPTKLIILGDFNFHFDNQSSPDVKRLSLSLSNHSLSQLVNEATHRSGHILDWLIINVSFNLVTSVSVTDELHSDHSAILFDLNITKPVRKKKYVTRCNLKALDIHTFSSQASERFSQTSDHTDLSDHYNTILRQLLDDHAPPTDHLLPDRPCAPWYTQDILIAKRKRRQLERQWRRIVL